jgi:hypothetical protein
MRKVATTATLLFTLLGTSVAHGQSFPALPPFKHIIIILQENRTPDNLFGAGPSQHSFPYDNKALACGGSDPTPFELGIDIDDGGPSNILYPPLSPYMCLTDVHNFSDGGGDHSHVPDWENQYDASPPGGVCGDGFDPPCLDGARATAQTPYLARTAQIITTPCTLRIPTWTKAKPSRILI